MQAFLLLEFRYGTIIQVLKSLFHVAYIGKSDIQGHIRKGLLWSGGIS